MDHDTDHTGLWQTPLSAFRDALAFDPMPGCGAAASVTADIGLALILKGLHLGQKHHFDAARAALIERGEALTKTLAPLADDDVAAFEAMMAALRKPKETEVEQAARDVAIRRAASHAVEVPLVTARRCLEALTLGREAMAHIESQFVSDATAGAYMLTAAIQSVLLNVAANLAALEDDEQRRVIKERDTLNVELAAARRSLSLEG